MNKPCCIYIIGHNDLVVTRGPVKVGIAADPQKRLRGLQTGNPNELQMVFYFKLPSREAALICEFDFSARHVNEQLHGEWYDLEPADAAARLATYVREHLEHSHHFKGQDRARLVEHSGVPAAEHLVKACGGEWWA